MRLRASPVLLSSLLYMLATGAPAAPRIIAPTTLTNASAFNFAQLQALIEGQGLKKIQDVMNRLPTDYTGLTGAYSDDRHHYTMMYESRSFQGSSKDSPRVILFGADARLIITYNGEPTLKRGNFIEVIQFNEQDRAYEFRDIEFPLDPDAPDAKVRFSDKNPDACLSCHGTDDPAPIWGTYPEWGGSYGLDKRVTEPGLYSQVRSWLKDFSDRAANEGMTGPYAYLGPIPLSEEYGLAYSNQVLSGHLSDLNSRVVFRKLRSSPQFTRYRYALLDLMSSTSANASASGNPRNCGASVADIKSSQTRIRAALLDEFKQRIKNPKYAYIHAKTVDQLTPEDHEIILKELLGLDRETLSRFPTSIFHNSGVKISTADIAMQYLEDLTQTDSEVHALVNEIHSRARPGAELSTAPGYVYFQILTDGSLCRLYPSLFSKAEAALK